ncbi:hypothetical protein [Aquimarina muelleri]|uniref:hypothetical protein n=1 Tax=Aquimarina muelleri TaxID=279356 RepID=UPI0004188D29|nr:hypothetical protein [Aquimarina muelleri]MCX2763754.1 hypothetical protein [Aquimarina muelleri]
MATKLKIAKLLIVFGFLLSIANYGARSINLYNCDNNISIAIEDSENSEEKEGLEKEDFKEKDKISFHYPDEVITLSNSIIKCFPEFNVQNSSVFLEYKTPPPRFI